LDWDVDENITLSELYQLGDDPAWLHLLRKIVGGVSDAGGDGAVGIDDKTVPTRGRSWMVRDACSSNRRRSTFF
jgi:hypothetical protein